MATNQQLQQLWIQAGGDPSKAALAAAVALAESGGDPNARNGATGSIGYWQINPQAHPASQATADPMGNARAAIAISNNGRNWQPWEAFTNGSYRQFLNGSGGSADQASASSGGGGGNWVADLFAPIFGTIGNWLLDAGMIVGGLVVFVWGTTVTILSTKEGKAVASAVGGGVLTVATGGTVKAATVGAVASGVANKRSKDAAARSKAATVQANESASELPSRNRKVIEGSSEQKRQADSARASRQRMES